MWRSACIKVRMSSLRNITFSCTMSQANQANASEACTHAANKENIPLSPRRPSDRWLKQPSWIGMSLSALRCHSVLTFTQIVI